MFNALKYTRNLEAVGIPREQAEAQVQLVLDAIDVEVATKTDLSEVRADIASFKAATKADFAEMRADFESFRAEMKADFAELRAEMSAFKAEMNARFSEFKSDIIIKLGATMVGSITVATAILGILIKS